MTDLADLRARLDRARPELLIRDSFQFDRQLARARAASFDGARFLRDLAAAMARAQVRVAARPATIRYPEELPVSQARETLIDAIREHPVVIVCGETGSGKTTQLPKLCLELGRGTRGLIGHTQPRRLAARSVAHRIAKELDAPLGELVGFETRFDRRVSERSLIKLMTDGILLAELQRDHELLAYDTIIIDEAHERSLNIDFLLGWLKRLLPRRPDLKVIVTSATLDPDRLSKHFDGAPILTVEGRTYPVTLEYRVPADDEAEDAVAEAIEQLWADGRRIGDTLVFLPGEREIHELSRTLAGRFPRAQVLPLYSRLPATQQDKVFFAADTVPAQQRVREAAKWPASAPASLREDTVTRATGGPPRIVLSTNVAETSVTVPGIRYVVDTGTARMSRWSTRLGIQQLHIEPVSQAAANQRAGRCGRVGPGTCVRLYAEDDFASRPAFTDPEVLRANLAGVILQMATLGLGDVDHFPWLEAPDSRQVSEGYRLLQTLGALDEDRALTPLGRELARLPLDPRVARIALAGRDSGCAHEAWVLAAALSVQDPHEFPPESQPQARQKHAEWRHPRSDFLTLLQLWNRWQAWGEDASNRQLRKLCKDHYVSYLRMEEWESVYRQIADLLTDRANEERKAVPPAHTPEQIEKLYAPLHRALLAGLVDHIGLKLPEKPEYQGPRGRRFLIFPGSTLAKKAPQWLMCAAIVHTSQVFARTSAAIEPEWLLTVAPHLVKRVPQQPEWNASRGEVSCTEHFSIFGLPLMKQARHYGAMDPIDARRIFILDGLVRGEIPNKPAFLHKNLALVEAVRDKEARLRRPDLLADESTLAAFYDARVPAGIHTVAALKRWLHEPGREHAQILRMHEPDVLRAGANADIAQQFPDHLDVGGHRLRLSYAHDPGSDVDGVSFHIPIALLFALPAARFDWLVPGLLAMRIEGLIRTLPQPLRRHCVPAAEYATALANSIDAQSGDLLDAICARFQAMTGVQLRPSDFAPDKLDAHLHPRLVLENADGKQMAESDSLADLQAAQTGAAREALAKTATQDDDTRRWVRETVLDWDFGDLPDDLRLPTGARAYPALRVKDPQGRGGISLALFESAEAAARAHAQGVMTLLLTRMNDRMRDLARTAKSKLGLSQIGSVVTPEDLARSVAERAAARAWPLASLRTQAAFQQALQHRGDFGRLAAAMLDEACGWLVTASELRKRIRALGTQWPGARTDIAGQLDSLLAPGFVDAIPDAQWSRLAVYLRAVAIRLDRLPNKPQRDLDLTAQLAPLASRLPSPWHPARWVLEEWRVALFAQELRAEGSPSADKLRAALVGS